jgi:hypothetical protein
MSFHIYEGARGSRFVGDHKLGPIVAKISKVADAPVNSHARDEAAKDLLHKLGQHTQQEVINLHARGVPGYGPANPVWRTTHCRRNDGVAYRWWPVGFLIPWWARGIDVRPERVRAFCESARARGYTVTATYPGSVGEAQHVNFRKAPRLPRRSLKLGDKGAKVLLMTRRLANLGYLDHGSGHFTNDVEAAVKAFQKHYHQKPDGVVGVHTQRAIVSAVRRHNKRMKRRRS